MKALALTVLLLSGCADSCTDCVTLTAAQIAAAMEKVWLNGYGKGFEDGKSSTESKKLQAI